MGKGRKLICLLLVLSGMGLLFYPDMKTWYMEKNTTDLVKNYCKTREDGEKEMEPDRLSALLDQIQAYNAEIYENGQEEFKDAWSVTRMSFDLDGLDDGMFGYIEIPAMELTLPLYPGASTEHLAQGAAILGGTSIPIGGENTNSVIAAHRGYRGAPYFRDIEDLAIGDMVYITNPWDTLIYRVESIDIIQPDDSDAVKIQKGRDMVTLMTCHPYRSHGKYRYLVYCIRDGDFAGQESRPGQGTYITASDGNVYLSSGNDIMRETIIRRCCAVAVLCIVGLTLIKNAWNRVQHYKEE